MSNREDELLAEFRLGEGAAIASVARIAGRVVRDRGYYVPREDQDDLVQETLVQLYQAVAPPEFEIRTDFASYVRTVAHHRCIDWMRRHRPSEPINPETRSSSLDPEERFVGRELATTGRRVLRLLGPICLRLIRLRVRDGLSYRDISQMLGRSEKGLRTRMYKCLERARALVEEIGKSRREEREREA